MTVVARMAGDPLGIAPALSKTAAGIDPPQAVYDVQSLEQALAKSVATRRFEFFLLGTFALASLIMAGRRRIWRHRVLSHATNEGNRDSHGTGRATKPSRSHDNGPRRGYRDLGHLNWAGRGLWLDALDGKSLYGVAPHDPAIFGERQAFFSP